MAWWLLLSWALAAPVALPADADPAQWRDVLSLVGLQAGPVDDEGVRLLVGPTGWTVEARWQGQVRRADVPTPESRSDREDVAQLAASLLRGLQAPSLPGLPSLPEPPEPAPPAPRATVPARPVAPPAPPRPPLEELLPAPPPGAQAALSLTPVAPRPVAAPAPMPPPAPAGPSGGFAAWGGPGLALRSTVQPAVAGQLWSGLWRGPLTVALGAEGAAPAALTRLSVERRVGSVSGGVGAWVGGELWGPRVGLGGMLRVDHRPFEGTGAAGGVTLPVGAVELAVEVPGSALRGAVRVARDLRVTELYVGDVREQVFEPWAVTLWLGLGGRTERVRAGSGQVR